MKHCIGKQGKILVVDDESSVRDFIGTALGLLAGYGLVLIFLSGLGSMLQQLVHFQIGGPIFVNRYNLYTAASISGKRSSALAKYPLLPRNSR